MSAVQISSKTIFTILIQMNGCNICKVLLRLSSDKQHHYSSIRVLYKESMFSKSWINSEGYLPYYGSCWYIMKDQALKIGFVPQSLETSKFYDSFNWYTPKEPSPPLYHWFYYMNRWGCNSFFWKGKSDTLLLKPVGTGVLFPSTTHCI